MIAKNKAIVIISANVSLTLLPEEAQYFRHQLSRLEKVNEVERSEGIAAMTLARMGEIGKSVTVLFKATPLSSGDQWFVNFDGFGGSGRLLNIAIENVLNKVVHAIEQQTVK